jgi:F-type H+-transporting ATPase subunit delta
VANRLSGQRYAQAIFELALENQLVEEWDQDLRLASDVLQDEEFAVFLKHAEVPAERKVAAIEAVLTEVHPMVRNLVSLLVSRDGVDAMADVQAGYSRLLYEHLGRQRVEVTAAVPLDDAELERITRFAAALTGKEVVVTTQVDENILGGLIIQIGDQLLDGSTSSTLQRMRQSVRAQAA